MSNILITAIGSFSANVVINNLHESGNRIIGCDIYESEWVANSLIVDKFYQSPYASNREEYVEFVKLLCKKEQIEYIIPLTDVEIDTINANRNEFTDVTLCISEKETVDICRNKYLLFKYLKKRDIKCLISTQLLKEIKIEEQNYPVVVKPYDGRSSQGLNYIANLTAMKYFIENSIIDDYVIQPKKEGKIITVDILRQKDFCVATPRVELLRTLNGAGTSVKVFEDKNLENICKEIATILNIKGCVNFEFIRDENGDYYFLECNPRFSGGVAFSCMAGYDYINNHLKCFNGEDVNKQYNLQKMTIARKYKEYITNLS